MEVGGATAAGGSTGAVFGSGGAAAGVGGGGGAAAAFVSGSGTGGATTGGDDTGCAGFGATTGPFGVAAFAALLVSAGGGTAPRAGAAGAGASGAGAGTAVWRGGRWRHIRARTWIGLGGASRPAGLRRALAHEGEAGDAARP